MTTVFVGPKMIEKMHPTLQDFYWSKLKYYYAIMTLAILFTCSYCAAAQDPVSWKFNAKKTSNNTYEIHFTAAIDRPWHIYSQTTPKGGPVPTKITLRRNPLVTPAGFIREDGRLETKNEDVFGINVKYFVDRVDFVQVVKLKSNFKTNLSGTVEYMACNDRECLRPTIIPFNIELNESQGQVKNKLIL